jgi:hypothetical protein
VADVEHDAVAGRVEHVMHRDDDLDGAHARTEMARIAREVRNKISPYFVTQHRKRLDRQGL